MNVREYYTGLNDRERDDFVSALNAMVEEGSEEALKGLRRAIHQLRKEIDGKFEERKKIEGSLQMQRSALCSVTDRLGSGPEKGDNSDLRLLETVMADRARHLHDRIGELSPQDKVARKSRLVQQLESLEQRRKAALAIQKMIVEVEAQEERPVRSWSRASQEVTEASH